MPNKKCIGAVFRVFISVFLFSTMTSSQLPQPLGTPPTPPTSSLFAAVTSENGSALCGVGQSVLGDRPVTSNDSSCVPLAAQCASFCRATELCTKFNTKMAAGECELFIGETEEVVNQQGCMLFEVGTIVHVSKAWAMHASQRLLVFAVTVLTRFSSKLHSIKKI